MPKSLPILMFSGVMDEVVPNKYMHILWEIAAKRDGNGKDSNESEDVFKSIYVGFGSHVSSSVVHT
jgi:hypothetical protein